MNNASKLAARSQLGVRIAWVIVALAAIGIALFSVPPYLTFAPGGSRIPLNPTFPWHIVGLSLHAIPAGLALLLGPFQFVSAIRTRYPAVHRTIGGVYLVCILIGSAMGVYSALVSLSGLAAQLGFLLLAITWFFSGLSAYRAIRRRQVQLHRIWMIRNYALTFAAVLLRVFLVAGTTYMQTRPSITFADVYTSSVWCSIFISYVVAEWFIVPRTRGASVQKPAKIGQPVAQT